MSSESDHVANVEMADQFSYNGENKSSLTKLKNLDREFDNTITAINAKFQSLQQNLNEQGHDLLSGLIDELDLNKVLYDVISNFKLNVSLSTEENKEFLQSKLIQVFHKTLCSKSSLGFTEEEILDIEQEGKLRYEHRVQ